MFIQTKKSIIKFMALILAVLFVLPCSAMGAETDMPTPRASHYLTSYNTYIYPAALGKIQVWFTVTGVDYMDDIGTLTIKIYESKDNETWTWVDTFSNGDTPSMLGHNAIYHSGHVEYQGTIGRYYKAYVCIWAGKDGGGDTRYMWTQPKKATLFAS